MNSTENILIAAQERANKDFEAFVHQHAGFSGTDPDHAERIMHARYYNILWDSIVSAVQECVRTENKKISLDTLLLELYKRGVNVDPTCISTQKHLVKMNNATFILEIRKEGIRIDPIGGAHITLAADESVMADMITTFDRMLDKLPNCYEEAYRKLLQEKKEIEILNSTAKGIVLDILKEKNADLFLEGIEMKFTVVKNNVPYQFYSTLGSLRDYLSDLLKNA